MNQIKTYPTSIDLAAAFATDFSAWLQKLPRDRSVNVALSGGSTPKLLFQRWADQYAETIDWNRVHFFWGDERCVPPDDPQSNFGVANQLWIEQIEINPANVHRIRGENEPAKEAERYAAEILQYVPVNSAGVPVFDLVLLGMGADGHTASIFPDRMSLLTSHKICETVVHPESGQTRVTLTGPVINAAQWIAFLIAGADKALVLDEVLNERGSFRSYPVSQIHGERLVFYLDEAATSG